MTRQLRPRGKKPCYIALAGLEDEEPNHAGPSKLAATIDEDGDSESDFEPEKGSAAKVVDNVDEDEDIAAEELEDEPIMKPTKRKRTASAAPAPTRAKKTAAKASTSKSKGKSKADVPPTPKTPDPNPPKVSKRQMYVLPTPSVHHRHRAMQIYSRIGRVERLVSRPPLFGLPSTLLTNGFTLNSKVTDRVNKSWGYNVGAGPLWDLAEDRGWYKEAITTGNGTESEAKRRPRVYPNLPIPAGWEILDSRNAVRYLPTDDVATDDGNLQPPPPVPCLFGFIKSQTRQDVKMFEAFAMSKFTPESHAHVFNAGGPVWGLDWCPIFTEARPSRSFKQYLAVAPFPSHSHSPDIGRRVSRPSYACIQIWSLSPTTNQQLSRNVEDRGQVRCEMVLCIDSGPAFDLRWCPLPSHDIAGEPAKPKKLGLLGGTFEDGSFSVFVVPDPVDMVPEGHDLSQPIFVRLPSPVIRIELEETACWSFDWANSEVVAIGTTNGTIAVYNLGPALKAYSDPNIPPITDLIPTHYLCVHQSAIRALGWIKAPPSWHSGEPRVDEDPTVIASAGYDGMECMSDIREGRGSVINRTRDVINALSFSPFAGGPITMDHENSVKAYSASPSMLGRGHSLMEPQGPVWSVHASEFHPQLVVGSADGSCSTTNTLKATRRGGSVPFFVYKIFQMDYNRDTKEYRMLDRFLPQEYLDRTTATRAAKGKAKNKLEAEQSKFPPSTGAWPREVGVHRVVWNNGNGLASSCLLAAGTASGLCRIDRLWGRWARDKIPYGSVGSVRMEDVDAMDVDSESEGSE